MKNKLMAKLLAGVAVIVVFGLVALMVIDIPAPTKHVVQTIPNDKFPD